MNSYGRFEGPLCLHLRGKAVQEENPPVVLTGKQLSTFLFF